MNSSSQASTQRTPVARGVLFNLAGLASSLLFALLAIPLLAAALGTDRFGVLALAWSALGFAALVNFGMARALTQAVARRTADRQPVSVVVWTALVFLAALGTAGGAALMVAAPWLAGALDVPPALSAEAEQAFRLLAVAVPFTVTGSAFVSLLEARHRWGQLQLVAVPLSAAMYFGPLLALSVFEGLLPVIGTLVAARLMAWCAWLYLVVRGEPSLRRSPAIATGVLRPLLAFGGWTSVSQFVSPLMLHADRFVIAGLASATAVAFYATPQEIVLRLGAVSGAVIAVLFPAFAASRTPERSLALLERGTTAVFILVFPVSFLLAGFPRELLGSWMGEAYAAEGAAVLRWLAVGLLINGFAKVPSAYLQGTGRPDLTGRLHLVELPLYGAALWLLVSAYGLQGAAAAWTLRLTIDAVALFWLSIRILPAARAVVWRAGAMTAAALIALGAVAVVPSPRVRLATAVVCVPLFLLISWTRLLDVEGRNGLRTALGQQRQHG